MSNPLVGHRVRLAALDLDHDAAGMAAWARDSEFLRLLQTGAARPWTAAGVRYWTEKEHGDAAPNPSSYRFGVRALADDRLIGTVDLDIPEWAHRDAWLAIAIGARADWSQGYGRDALRLLLRFAFMELNLFRVTLSVFSYNPRAVHVYEKLGFVHEGTQRDRLRRDGQVYDLHLMGLLRSEWQATVEGQSA